MNRKIRFVWEAKNIDEHVDEIEFSERFQDSVNTCPLFCGKFNREVSISNVNVNYIHFTDFRVYKGLMSITTGVRVYSLNLRCYENLVFEIIEPGITFFEGFISFN